MTGTGIILKNGFELPNFPIFRSDTYDYLKGKILGLNPGADINWDDFEIKYHPPGSKDNGTITLSVKDSAKHKYVRPNHTVEFTYTIDTSIEDIILNVLRLPKQPHYDDAEKIKDWLESNLDGWRVNIMPAYKTPEGGYTSSPGEDNVNTLDINARLMHVIAPSYVDDTIVSTDNPGSGLSTKSLIPYLDDPMGIVIEFICIRDAEATLDFNINGGEFTINAFGLRYHELLAPETTTASQPNS